MLRTSLLLLITIAQTEAFNPPAPGSLPNGSGSSGSTSVNDEHRRQFLSLLLSSTATVVAISKPFPANAQGVPSQSSSSGFNPTTTTIHGIHDPQLGNYHNPSLPNWTGTSLPGPLSLSETYSQIIRTTAAKKDNEPILTMGRWPDPILRHPASPVPLSVFQSNTKIDAHNNKNSRSLRQLQLVARALKNTARKEGAVGLAAQQCGVDASLIFIDGVVVDAVGGNDHGGTTKTGSNVLPRFWSAMDNSSNEGAFGQSIWRKSRKEVSGEGVYEDYYSTATAPKTTTNERSRIVPTMTQQQQQQPRNEERGGVFLVNPRIVHRSPESEMLVWTEECLVLPPEFRATLLRDAEVTVEYESLECLDNDVGDYDGSASCGTTKQITLRGELARCAQHEMDHDRGTLIVDHVSLDELLSSADGDAFMADIENSDEGHSRRMQRAYARGVVDSTLLPSKDRFVALADERDLGQYRTRIVERDGVDAVENQTTRPWFVKSANAIEQDGVMHAKPATATTSASSNNNSNPQINPDCDDECIAERKRIIEQRRAMMKQARSNTSRGDVLELSKQRATMYGAEYRGLPPQYCSKPGFCP